MQDADWDHIMGWICERDKIVLGIYSDQVNLLDSREQSVMKLTMKCLGKIGNSIFG